MPCRRRNPGTPARRWASRRSPIRCGRIFCATTRPIRCGPTATASCCRTATPRMLLYALLHLAGVRRAGRRPRHRRAGDQPRRHQELPPASTASRPGHPEYGRTTGVETTTGPLGQGCGNSVGMAIASRWLGARYNRPNFTIFDFDVYTICSDGDLMEGVASEAASLAGHLRLANLCWIYDSNTVTIEGHTDLAFSEDVETRFKGYRWNVVRVRDANDTAAVAHALRTLPPHRGSTDPHHRRQHHRLRRAAQTEHRGRARDPLGEEEVAPDQALLRLAGRRAISGARRRLRPLPRRHRPARPRAARRMDEDVRRLREGISASRARDRD